MKEIIRNMSCLLLISTGILFIPSCKLDSPVYSNVVANNFWQTPDQIAAGVAPAYGGMNSLNAIGGDIANMIEGTSDEMVVPTRGNDWGDAGHWDALWFHTLNPGNSNWNNGWNDVFGSIGKCNIIISAVNGLQPAPSALPSILAQVKTLRAYYYYIAMEVFGNIPIVTDTTLSSAVPNSSRANVYNFILNELNSSLPNLTATVDASTYGRVTKYFAYALLARLYLNAQVYTGVPGTAYQPGTPQWQKASDFCDSILNSGKYSLATNYFDNFSPSNGPGVAEIIFAQPVDHANNLSNNWENAILHYQSYQAFGMSTGANLWNGFCSASEFYSTFDTTSVYTTSGENTLRTYNDQRSGQWLIGQQFIGTYNYPPSQQVVVAGPTSNYIIDAGTKANLAFNPNFTAFSDASPAGRLAGVRNIKYFPAASSGNNASDMDNDFVVFRLGEIYLIKAEAELRMGNPSTALPYVNAIRTRAYGSAANDWGLGDLTLSSLLQEKGREMAYEGVRRSDLIRYEVAGNGPYFSGARTVGSKAADPDQHLMIFPIPTLQLNNNSALKQNPGY